ncbi:MAG: ribonuclease III [Planctomycetes bacterium]|nr:ribonuclease III [Planctomycetota bacterium]
MDGLEPKLTYEESERVTRCQERLGYRFRNPRLLLQALTHASIKTIDNPSNERLEFLGDSVLGLVVTEFLYNYLEHLDEGELTQIKSVVVSSAVLARESERLSLERFYWVGKGVTRKRQLPPSLRANVFEAVVAAIYRDAGIEPARRFILRNLYHHILAACADRGGKNYKSILQQMAQREFSVTPTYKVISESGPDHYKSFEVIAMLGDRALERGRGRSKKEAEQVAAQESLRAMRRRGARGRS